jgi:hypothetical protein
MQMIAVFESPPRAGCVSAWSLCRVCARLCTVAHDGCIYAPRTDTSFERKEKMERHQAQLLISDLFNTEEPHCLAGGRHVPHLRTPLACYGAEPPDNSFITAEKP